MLRKVLLFLSCICLTIFNCTAAELYRGNGYASFCPGHQEQVDLYQLAKEFLPLIPRMGSCWHMNCSICADSWYECICEDTDEGMFCEFLPFCKCKNELYKQARNARKWKTAEDLLWQEMPSWTPCNEKAIYSGYFHPSYRRYFSFFLDYLKYCDANRACSCYWPEISPDAAAINNFAFNKFLDMVNETDFGSTVYTGSELEDLYGDIDYPEITAEVLSTLLVSHCFFFSDYVWVCKDLERFAMNYFDDECYRIAKKYLNDFLEELAPLFAGLYKKCQSQHPHSAIQEELVLLNNYINVAEFSQFNVSYDFPLKELGKFKASCSCKTPNFREKRHVKPSFSMNVNKEIVKRPVQWKQADVYLILAQFLNNACQYEQALSVLDAGIQLNIREPDLHLEKAISLFQLNYISEAISEYVLAKSLMPKDPLIVSAVANYPSEAGLQFTMGFFQGTYAGVSVSSKEFLPSLYHGCCGIMNGLWAFATSPVEVSKDLVNAAYDLGEFISQTDVSIYYEYVVPELKELRDNWQRLDSFTKGQKIGFVLGKYGVEIFAPCGLAKGLNKILVLRRANAVLTLECCAASEVKKLKILEEVAKIAEINKSRSCAAKLIVRNRNSAHHILQEKHGWNKLVTITGNTDQDIASVVKLLEEHEVYLDIYRFEREVIEETGWIKRRHRKMIGSSQVEVYLAENPVTGEMFFNNGWVMR